MTLQNKYNIVSIRREHAYIPCILVKLFDDSKMSKIICCSDAM